MREINISCSWIQVPEFNVTLDNGEEVHATVKTYNPKAEFCLDLTDIYSKLSENFHPSKRYLMTSEPEKYIKYNPDVIRDWYGKVWTHSENIIKRVPQARLFTFTAPWVHWEPYKPLMFGVSGIYSSKNNPNYEGYAIRRRIIGLENLLTIPSMFYSAKKSWRGKPVDYPLETKDLALRYMFHVAIENTSEPNYFSEKIIDAFLCRCVPVYYGDPKIGRVFDERGIITLNTIDPLKQLNGLTEKDYTDRLSYIEENYRRAVPFKDRFKNVLEEVFKWTP